MSISQSTVPLIQFWSIPEGSHVYYGYQNPDIYVMQAVSFICAGIGLGQQVLMIEEGDSLDKILSQLASQLPPEDMGKVHVLSQDCFYEADNCFKCRSALDKLARHVKPFMTEGARLRLWEHADWKDRRDLERRLSHYECRCDITLSGLGFTTVSVYDANRLPAFAQNTLLKHHEYWMTDEQLVRSCLYRQFRSEPAHFPSLSRQAFLESEVDLYKQKLDFVHVVSHEVRNPLTVIKAYAALLLAKERDCSDRYKLKAICDYVDVIDNEISHIINTEQMLSTEALWRKKLIQPLPLLMEVLEIMGVKARTQNIALETELCSMDNLTLLGNSMGFKLIVSNLLSNAIKYSEEGEGVRVKTGLSEESLTVTVTDHGVGMSEEQLKLLFLKYEKQNEEKGGQGIGLFMVRKLLDHFGGTVHVESKLGEGTTVRVAFPLQSEAGCPVDVPDRVRQTEVHHTI